MKTALSICLFSIISISSFAEDHLGGRMRQSGCYADNGSVRSMQVCVDKFSESSNSFGTVKVRARAFYRDPMSDGTLTEVSFGIELLDPSNFFDPEAALPVLARVQLCNNQWGCSYETQSLSTNLSRVPNERKLRGVLNVQFMQNLKSDRETWVNQIQFLLPGVSEVTTIQY